MKDLYLECGKIVNTHGVRGGVKIDSYCDTPAVFAKLPCVYIKSGSEYRQYKLLKASVYRDTVIAMLDTVTTVEAAEALKNKTLYATRDSVPRRAGDVFLADIIGLDVIDIDTSRVYGRVVDIDKAPASYIYTVRTDSGDVLLPAVKEFIKEIDVERGVFIRPIEGFFDEI